MKTTFFTALLIFSCTLIFAQDTSKYEYAVLVHHYGGGAKWYVKYDTGEIKKITDKEVKIEEDEDFDITMLHMIEYMGNFNYELVSVITRPPYGANGSAMRAYLKRRKK